MPIYTLDAEGRPQREFAPVIDGTLGGADALFMLLSHALAKLRISAADTVVILADGARWIWNRVAKLLTDLDLKPGQWWEVVASQVDPAFVKRMLPIPVVLRRTNPMSERWLQDPIPALDDALLEAALVRQRQLTKPPGSLGQLEALGATLAAMQDTQRPTLERVRIVVFAADHGVTVEGVSAYPQAVTAEMIRNFARGGAAISVLARLWGADLEVMNVGTVIPLEDLSGVLDRRLGAGTANFVRAPAMTAAQREQALAAGREAAERARLVGAQLFIGGDMGIGNTTAAAALGCALLKCRPAELAGPGTGLDAAGVARKARVIEAALTRHPSRDPLEALACLGGFEIAALVGALLRCAQMRIPVLVDGFITSVAALAAVHLRPELRPWLFFGHRSAEPGHGRVLQALGAEPLLDLGMRLGEGSGAAMALPILRAAAALHAGMATFAEAGVSEA